jgi:hypothetical protein
MNYIKTSGTAKSNDKEPLDIDEAKGNPSK